MDRFRSIFKGKHTFLPVVHVQNAEQALRNIKIARDNGADGAFLINHDSSDRHLHECYGVVANEFPDFWVGLNFLRSGNEAVRIIPKNSGGLWVDDAGIEERENGIFTANAQYWHNIRKRIPWKGLYFGGVAFKYQKPVINLAGVTRAAILFVDVITTSGDATGFAPDLEKILVMRKASGTHPLVIASGITPENVRMYMPHADGFLVASGISDSHTELNPSKVAIVSKLLGR